MWIIFKVFSEFASILFLSHVLMFGPEAYGILVAWPGIELTPPTLKGKVSTTEPASFFWSLPALYF